MNETPAGIASANSTKGFELPTGGHGVPFTLPHPVGHC